MIFLGSDKIPRGEQRVPVESLLDGTDPDALPFLANVALHLDDIQGAKHLMTRYLTVQPNDIVALKLWAAGLYDRGEHATAAPVLTRVIEIEPSSKEAWILLVRIFTELKDVAGAEPALERARAARIDEVEYWQLRTDILSIKGDLEGALASLERARELGLNDHAYWENRITLLVAKKDLERALVATREARTRFPRENAMLFEEFYLDMQLKRFDDAIMLMEDARKENHGDSLLLARLGIALAESGNFDRADQVTASALDLVTRGVLNGASRDPIVGWARGKVLKLKNALDQSLFCRKT